jgi:hypothetical protein
MYIRNRTFKDEDTLMEVLFDFSLGNPTSIINGIISGIEKELSSNKAYIDYYNSLADEEDRMELQTEESRIRLAEKLQELFDIFEVKDSKLYGIKAAQRKLLYEIELY